MDVSRAPLCVIAPLQRTVQTEVPVKVSVGPYGNASGDTSDVLAGDHGSVQARDSA